MNIEDFLINSENYGLFFNILYNHMKDGRCNYVRFETENIIIYLENRPSYCDRGKFKLLAYCIDPSKHGHIDYQDGFPRYYFNWHCVIEELWDFLLAKKQKTISYKLGRV